MYCLYEESTHPELTCPLCDSLAKGQTGYISSRLATLVVCATCGKFKYDGDYLLFGHESQSKLRYKISHATRVLSESALLSPPNNSFFPIYDGPQIEQIINRPDPSVQEKMQTLLQFLRKLTEFPGQIVDLDADHDYAIICAKGSKEAVFYIESLCQQELIKREQSYIGVPIPRVSISAKGWKELEQIDQLGNASSNGFVAMSFSRDRDIFSVAISDAIKAAGYKPIRVDQIDHINKIDDEIIARIRASKFLVADFTQQKNGVYFEAEFMLGLGRPVFWICQDHDLERVHFDTRQYNTIDYKNEADLKMRLQLRIEAILGKGPLKE